MSHPPTRVDATLENIARELDSRSGDGLEVRLLWHPRDNRVWVAVNDTKTGDSFDVQIGRGDRALDVFHHPYAYAPGRLLLRPQLTNCWPPSMS
jgi:hypothetical protein